MPEQRYSAQFTPEQGSSRMLTDGSYTKGSRTINVRQPYTMPSSRIMIGGMYKAAALREEYSGIADV
jgi:hypothetical protein